MYLYWSLRFMLKSAYSLEVIPSPALPGEASACKNSKAGPPLPFGKLRTPRDDSTNKRLRLLRVLDHFFAGLQPYVGFLPIPLPPGGSSPAPHLAFKIGGAHRIHFNFEKLLDGFSHLDFGGLRMHFKAQCPALILGGQALFGDDGALNHLVDIHSSIPCLDASRMP